METGEYVPGSVWFYAPNKGAPVAFAFFFLVSGMWHIWQCSKYASWRITGALPWCASLMIVGFTLREVGVFFYDNSGLWISSRVFLYVALTYYELSNYVVLARLLQYVPYHAPVHPGRSISAINSLNILIMTLICSGAPQSVNTNNNSGQIASGKALLKAALLLQLVVMIFLLSVAAKWQWNCSRRGKLLFTSQGGEQRNVKRVLSTLYCSCALITCCTIFRAVEYLEYSSFTTPAPGAFLDTSSVSLVIRYEWFFWVFDVTVMLCNSALWSVRHPARDLPRSERTYLAEDGTERQGLAIEDLRRCWAKLLDPFDIWGLVVGYHEKWWEVGVEDTSTSDGAHLED